jgi:hypothetical protein
MSSTVDIEPRERRHTRVRRRPIQAVLRTFGLEAGRRRRPYGGAAHRPVHAAALWGMVTFGMGLIASAPGSAQAVLVVSDIEATHGELVSRGIDATDVWHGPPFPVEARQPGIDPERASYGSFCSFNDPDGNLWLVQEVTTRAPGRVWED